MAIPISNVPRRVQYAPSGVGPYAFTFEILVNTDLAVYQGTELLTLTADYTVSINPNGTGSVTLTSAATGTITIIGARAIQRTTDFVTGGDFRANTVNDEMDSQTIFSQQLAEELGRGIKIAPYSPTTVNTELPAPIPNGIVAWNSTANAINYIDPSDIGTAVAYATAYADTFTGNGSQTAFTLTRNPAVLFNLDVSLNGVTQVPGVDYTLSGTTLTMTTPPPNTSVLLAKYKEGLPNYEGDSQDVRFLPAGTGAQQTTVQAKLRETVSVKDFGAVGDGVTDDTAAVQAAIDYCLSGTSTTVTTLMVNGVCRLGSSIKIDIPIDDVTNRLIIYGNGERAGFYTNTNVNMFDTNLPVTTDPATGNITFENIVFETSLNTNNSFVLTGGKFLRMYFIGCEFYKIRCLSSAIYTQSYRFERCRVRSTLDRFFESAGMYDIHAQIDGKFCVTGFRSLDTVRGITEASFTECVWEGNTGSLIECTGANGLTVAKNYIEFNSAISCNFALGVMPNNAITVQGNIFVQSPTEIADPNFYDIDWGLTTNGTSIGNFCNGKLHKGLNATDCVSIGDSFVGVISSPNIRTVNGATRFGVAQDVWEDSANQINKSAAGNFALGSPIESTVRIFVKGSDQTSANSAGVFADSAGNTIIGFRNDRLINMPALQNFADDAAAAAGGIPVGFLYRNGSVVQVRVS